MKGSGALSTIARVRASLSRSPCSWRAVAAASLRRRSSSVEIIRPATPGVPIASTQRTSGLDGSWIASTTA